VKVKPNQTGSEYKDELVEVRNQVLTALGVKGLSTTWLDHEWGLGKDGTVHHAGGTLRMSADGSGVVDDTLKFLAYDNLYCCDVSVFPTIPAANPSLTLTALALRLANTIAGRLELP
jgi:choline dehydrogenase-like flavoprotein